MSEFNDKVIAEFRENDGVVGGFFEEHTLLLLHTTGAKSGLARISPLMTTTDDDRYILVASSGGAENHPSWYHNIVANPNVTIEVGTEKFDAVASIAEEPERTRLYSKMEERFDGFTEYKNKVKTRVIPIITVARES